MHGPTEPGVCTPVADFMNGNVVRWKKMIQNLVRSNPGELRLMHLENRLLMTDHLAYQRWSVCCIHFNTLQGRRWINDAFQTKNEELEEELRTTDSLARTSLTGRDRVRSNVPEPLANRLKPLAQETSAATPAAPSSDVGEKLGTAPPPRRQPFKRRLEDLTSKNPTSSQASTSASNFPATIPVPAGNSSSNLAPVEEVESANVLPWNPPDPVHGDSTRLT